jgi:hypothetical protein
MSRPSRPILRCATVLADGPRAGQVCGRRYLAPHEACEKHRPPPPARVRPKWKDRDKDRIRQRDNRARARRTTGIPAGWEV